MDDTTGMPQSPTPEPQEPPSTPVDTELVRPGPASDVSKLLAAIGYVFGIVAVVAILVEPYKDEPFVRFHASQAIALWVVGIVASIIPFVGWIVGLAVFVVGIVALVKTLQGKYWEIPIIYSVIKGYAGL